MKKSEYPKAIADLLGLEPVTGLAGPWMSTQGTVLEDWVRAVAEALDVPYVGKVATVRAVLESLGISWNARTMGSEETASGGGGNISLPAFEALYEVLRADQTAAPRVTMLGGRPQRFRGQVPDVADDQRELRALRIRRGQAGFRAYLLDAYEGKCALTDWDAIPALEAAHIRPYGLGGGYDTNNGILMRADVHTLFDLRLIALDPNNLEILVAPKLRATAAGRELAGRHMRLPRKRDDHPNFEALAEHRRRSHL